MKVNRLALIVPGLAVLFTAMIFIACGGNGTVIPQSIVPSAGNPATDLPGTGNVQDPAQSVDSSADNRVILDVPSINELAIGEEFTAIVSLDLTDEVHQGVLRILYDDKSMTPLEIIPGEILPADMIRIAALDKPGFLPLAFTALPDKANIRPGTGEVFRIRFRLDQPGAQAGRITFRSDREFLQLRNRDGEHIRFDVESRAGGRHAE